MPKFSLDTSGTAPTVRELLDDFTFGFIEAMFFTKFDHSTTRDEWFDPIPTHRREQGQTDGEIPDDSTLDDLGAGALKEIIVFCAVWKTLYANVIKAACACEDYDEAQAGRDFWFTINGHGVGFWDRKQLEVPITKSGDEIGAILTRACPSTQVSLYWDGTEISIDFPTDLVREIVVDVIRRAQGRKDTFTDRASVVTDDTVKMIADTKREDGA